MAMFDLTFDSFGTLLKHFRKRQRLTQQQLADTLGLHRNTIGRWEEGSFLPESKTLILELARCLHLSGSESRQLLDASLLTPTPIWSVPYPRNPFFTGREDLLALLRTRLAPSESAALPPSYALHGLGGIGKTQLALEYAYRSALEYRAVFWISAETLEAIHASLLRIAQHLDLPEQGEADHHRRVAAVRHWLQTRNEWLVIWDNLEDLALLPPLFPAMHRGATLITTRHQALGTLAYGINLEPLDAEEGMLFLFRRAKILGATATGEQVRDLAASLPGEYAAAREVVTTLGGLPLALDQAGAYLEETRCRLVDFLEVFRLAPLRLLGERGTHAAHPAPVVTTFALAFEQLEQHHQAAAELLTACCFLAPDEIPEALLTRQAALLPPVLHQALLEPFTFQESMKKLLAYALIQRQPERQTLRVHRLVQAVLRERLSVQEQREWRGRMLRVLCAAFPVVTPEGWEECECLLPHVLACVAALAEQDDEQEILAELVSKAADYLRERAAYQQAEALYRRALAIWEQSLGPAHLTVARVCHQLAFLAWAQGKYEQAEDLGERAVHIREQVLGPMHPEVATSLNSLANFALEQGNYERAEHLHRRVVRIREQTLGSAHPTLAKSFNNLGILAAVQGKDEQAEFLYQRALSLLEKALPLDHPTLAEPLNNLALLYTEQEKYEQARAMGQRALAIWEKALGPEHPQVAEALTTLARLFVEQGKEEQAEALYRRALAIWERSLGPAHPQVAYVLGGLGRLSQKQGKSGQAEGWYQRALAVREGAQGSVHPETAQILYDLALLRQQQGKVCEALALAERALSIRAQSLGTSHPKTVATRVYYAQLVQERENLVR